MLYTVQDTTMTALGDAVRKQTTKYIGSIEKPTNPDFILTGNTAEFTNGTISGIWEKYIIQIDLEELLGDKFSQLTNWYIEYSWKSNNGMALPVALRLGYSQGGSYNAIYFKGVDSPEVSSTGNVIISFNQSSYQTSGYYLDVERCLGNNDIYINNHFNYEIKFWACNSDNEYLIFNTMTPAKMVDEIDGLICLTEDDLIFTTAQNFNYNGVWDNVFQKIGNHIILQNCYSLSNTFYGSKLEDLSMITIDGGYNKLSATFQSCSNLKYLPTVKSYRCWSLADTFAGCNRLRSLGNFFDNITIEDNGDTTEQWGEVFQSCYSLRTIPQKVSNALWNGYYYYYGSVYYRCFMYCYTLDEIIGLGVESSYARTPTKNFFQNTFDNCHRLKNMTFLTNEDGTPISSNMINQTIDLSYSLGYGSNESYILNYNSGITADKKVYDDATYQALKDDPDWYTLDINYSRYNHDSAVNTINSLPDVSAKGTNTIKFKGAAGALTDGGAINTLTEEEIAVATAKGWTVSLV